MFSRKTVFVVGAGASHEVGLPIGSGLKAKIASALNMEFKGGYLPTSGDRVIWDAFQKHALAATPPAKTLNPYQEASWAIRDAMTQAISIDNFLDAHQEDPLIPWCGKLAIVRTILSAEKSSQLNRRESKSFNFSTVSSTWYNAFFQLLTENVKKTDIESLFENIVFITYNYDRCIEEFIRAALQNYYLISVTEAEALAGSLKVLHPYGQVGRLRSTSEPRGIAFGQEDGVDLIAVAKQLRTFTEKFDDEDSRGALQAEIESADTIVFLGFAYHGQNLELLRPRVRTNIRRIFGTAFEISGSDCALIADDLRDWVQSDRGHPTLHLHNDKKCAGLFQEHWRALGR